MTLKMITLPSPKLAPLLLYKVTSTPVRLYRKVMSSILRLYRKVMSVTVRLFVEKLCLSARRLAASSTVRLGGLVLLSMLTLITVSYASVLAYYHKRIYPRVWVAGVPLGNLAIGQAAGVLEARYNPLKIDPITITSQERSWQLQPATLGLMIDATDSAQAAFAVGHSIHIVTTIKEQTSLLLHKKVLPLHVTIDQAALDRRLEEISQASVMMPQSSHIEYVEGQFIVTPSIDGQSVDIKAVKAEITELLAWGKHDPITLPITKQQAALTSDEAQKLVPALSRYAAAPLTLTLDDQKITLDVATLLAMVDYQKTDTLGVTISPEKIRAYVADFAQKLDRPARDAQFNFVDGKVTAFAPSQEGQTLDQEALAKSIEQAVTQGGVTQTLAIPVKKIAPKVTTEAANTLGVKELLGAGESNYRNSPQDRIFNIGLAASRLNGAVIPAGAEFSFNDTVGDISQASGYKQALVILSGRTVLGDGGGVCQVSTTLFRAILHAGLPVAARTAHAFRVSYYENDRGPGFDATIYQPGVDLKFKNDTGNNILIAASVDKATTKLHVDLYGVSDGRITSLSKSVYLSQSPVPPDVYQDDPTLPKGTTKQVEHSVPGAKVYFTRTVTRNGETLISETFNSNYRPWAAVFLVGTKEN